MIVIHLGRIGKTHPFTLFASYRPSIENLSDNLPDAIDARGRRFRTPLVNFPKLTVNFRVNFISADSFEKTQMLTC